MEGGEGWATEAGWGQQPQGQQPQQRSPPEAVPPQSYGHGGGGGSGGVDPYAGMYDVPGGGPERIDEVATVVQNVDYAGADYAQSVGGYTQTKRYEETAAKFGWMWKKGGSKEKSKTAVMLEGRRKNWSRRFFVTEGTNLLYYVSMDDRSMGIPEKGKVVLNDFVIRPSIEDAKPGTFGFALSSPTREFELACESEDEKRSWIEYLQSVLDKIAGKVLVSDSNIERAAEVRCKRLSCLPPCARCPALTDWLSRIAAALSRGQQVLAGGSRLAGGAGVHCRAAIQPCV